MSFTILTDTSCNLPQQLVDDYRLSMIPLRYFLDGEEHTSYTDGKQADFQAFYTAMRDGKVVTTTLASQADAAEVAQACAERGEDLLYLGFSSGISGTYGACSAAIAEIAAQHPERKMYSVDTRAASAGQGLLITYVARMRDEGKTIEECRDWAEEHRLNICHWFTVDDLMFLKRGGRVSAVSAVFGTALSIKPVMHMDDAGTLKNVTKARGRKAALKALAQRLADTATDPADQTVFICHGDCLDDAEYTAEQIRALVPVKDIIINYVGPVIGAHTGPGVISVFFVGTHR